MKVEEFLKEYPWNSEYLKLGPRLDAFWEFDLEVRIPELWPHLIDTSRFNRALGLSKMDYEERDGQLHGSTINGGVEQVWVEDSWQWIEGRAMIGGRTYSKGFGRYVRSIYDFTALDGGRGTRLRVYFGWITRNWLFGKILKFSMPWLYKRYEEVLSQICADIKSHRPAIYEQRLEALDESVEHRIVGFRDSMMERGLGAGAVKCLLDFVRTSDEMDAYRIRVPALALQFGVDEDALLKACLHATRLGLLRMSWDLICPHCRGVRHESSNLKDVAASGACDACQVEFASDEENALEISFQIHPSVREIPRVFYCAAEPAGKRHIKLQQHIAAGASRHVEPVLKPGRYRLRVLGQGMHRHLDIVSGEEPESVEWDGSVEGLLLTRKGLASEVRVGGGSSFKFVNESDEGKTYIIEDAGWSDLALRPGRLFSCHEFRDLFSEEFLDVGVGLSVGSQTLLFTDVVGSTRFYAECGDPQAYAEIRVHFDEILPIVARHRGAVVKTIGDAVMAAFADPVDALKACTEMHRCFHEHRQDLRIRIRISLNTGNCIAVNLNTNIDYFGTAVNVAAKLQAFAEAGDVAFSEAVWQSPGVQACIAEQGIELEQLQFESSAFEESIPVYRWNSYGHKSAG